MSWSVPQLPVSSEGIKSSSSPKSRHGAPKQSSNALELETQPDFGATLKAATAKPAPTQTESNQTQLRKTPEKPVNSRKQPKKETSQSTSTPDESDTPPPDNQPADPQAATPTETSTDDPQKCKASETSSPEAPAKPTTEVPNPQVQVNLPTPSVAPQSNTPAPAQDDPSASPVKQSPFLDAFGGIAEGLHKLAVARQAAEAAAHAAQEKPTTDNPDQSEVKASDVPESTQRKAPEPQKLPETRDNHQKSDKQPASQATGSQLPTTDPADTTQLQPTAAAVAPPVTPADPALAIAPAITDSVERSSSDSVASPNITSPFGLAPQSQSTGAESARIAQESPASDAQQTFDQVVLGLRGNFDARNGKAEIQLNPPNLGVLHVSVSLEHGALTAQFQSSSDVVRDLLKDNLGKLKTVLEGQGVTVDRLAVDALPQASSGSSQSSGQQASFGSAANDGRSAGQYNQEQRPGNRRSDDDAFSRLFRQAADVPQAPIDLVA